MSALLDAISASDSPAALQALDDPQAAREVGPDGTSALLLARYAGLLEVAAAICIRREITLAEAAAVGDTTAVGRLLDAGTSPQDRAPDGFTALHLACYFDNVGAAALLVRAGADLSARATGTMTVQALHSAAASPTGKCVPLLIGAGAAVDETQTGGFTPLHEAALRKDEPMVELLLAAGATPDLQADDGRDAADMASASGAIDLATRLRARRRSDSRHPRE